MIERKFKNSCHLPFFLTKSQNLYILHENCHLNYCCYYCHLYLFMKKPSNFKVIKKFYFYFLNFYFLDFCKKKIKTL